MLTRFQPYYVKKKQAGGI